jgi:thioredoxin 1
VDVTDADFAERVLASEQLVVVDVWAEWCEPCQIMSAYMGFLAQEYAGRVLVSALDADTNPATTERYGILGLPTLLFFRGGVEVERQVGVVDYATLRGRIEQILAMDSPLIT